MDHSRSIHHRLSRSAQGPNSPQAQRSALVFQMQGAAAVAALASPIGAGESKHSQVFVELMGQGELNAGCDQTRLGVIGTSGRRCKGRRYAIQVLVESLIAIKSTDTARETPATAQMAMVIGELGFQG